MNKEKVGVVLNFVGFFLIFRFKFKFSALKIWRTLKWHKHFLIALVSIFHKQLSILNYLYKQKSYIHLKSPGRAHFFLISQNFVAPLGTLKGRKSKNQKTTFSLIDTMRNILDFHQNRLTPRPISGTAYRKWLLC